MQRMRKWRGWLIAAGPVVGAMGILTILWVSVHERTSEIGLVKALGASDRQVLLLFLAESGALSPAGGAAGVAPAVLLAWGIGSFLWVQVPVWIIPVALLLSLGVGVAAGRPPRRAGGEDGPGGRAAGGVIVTSHESAGSHALMNVPTAAESETAAAVVDRLRTRSYDWADLLFVVEDGRLRGWAETVQLLAASPETPVRELMHPLEHGIRSDEDQERAAHEVIRLRLPAAPIVDDGERFVGAIPARDLLSVLYREHVEDLHRLAGIRREVAHARDAIQEPPARQLIHRLPWLLLGFAGSVVATFVVSRFQRVLEAKLVVAFFIPGLVYLADAIGTQTEAIAVRGLSLSRQTLRRLLIGEIGGGFLIGLTLGTLALPLVWLLFGDLRLGLSVSISLVAASTFAATIGLMLPWTLSRLHADPAYGSGPLATIIQDVLTLLIYFTLISAMGA